ncbi:NUDIX domain-containing protein [Spirillospora sp. NPDC049652]
MGEGTGSVAGRVVEQTVTVFTFKQDPRGLLLGVAWHARFGGWLVFGGHREDCETLDQAAVREVVEEGGCRVRLLPGPSVELPAGFPHTLVPGPWMIVGMEASPDNHTPAPHVHQDHVFCAVWVEDVQEPETRVRWMTEAEVAGTPDLPEDTRLQAQVLFDPVRAVLAG